MSPGEAKNHVKRALPAHKAQISMQIHKEITKDGGECADKRAGNQGRREEQHLSRDGGWGTMEGCRK